MSGRIHSKLVQASGLVLLTVLIAPQAASANVFHTHGRKVPDLVVGFTVLGGILTFIFISRLLRRLRQAAADHRRRLEYEEERDSGAQRIAWENEAREANGEPLAALPTLRNEADYRDEEEEEFATARRWLFFLCGSCGIGFIALGCYLTYTQVLV